jgi:hypothetical protein
LETPPALAVKVAACAVVTADTVAVNAALVAFAGTVIVAGTATAALPLPKLTLKPVLPAAVVSVTEQASLPAPVRDGVAQESALNATAVPAAAGLFTVVPQPNDESAARKHANMPDMYGLSSLEIEPRPQAQCELNTRVTCVARSPKRPKMWRATCETSEKQRSQFKDIRLHNANALCPEENESFSSIE